MPFPLDIQYVRRAEEKLGIKLPLGYVVSMCRHNGGSVRALDDWWQLYPILDDRDRKRLKRTCNDIVYQTRYARQSSPGFPPAAVAIARDGGGNELVFLPAADIE